MLFVEYFTSKILNKKNSKITQDKNCVSNKHFFHEVIVRMGFILDRLNVSVLKILLICFCQR